MMLIKGSREMISKRLISCLTAVLVVLLAVTGCNKEKVVEEEAVENDAPVEVVTVKQRDLSERLSVTGEFLPIEDMALSLNVGGKISELPVEEGIYIRKGELIAGLDTEDLRLFYDETKSALTQAEAEHKRLVVGARKEEIAQAEATLNDAKITYDAAVRNSKRVQDMYSKGMVSDQELDANKVQFSQAKTGFELATENLQMLKAGATKEELAASAAGVSRAKAALAIAEKNLKEARLYAPQDGFLTQKSFEVNEFVDANIPLIRLLKLDPLKIVVKVPELWANKVGLNQDADIKVRALDDASFKGRISAISPALDPQTRTLDVEIQVPNKEYRLKPYMFADITIIASQRRGVVAVPTDAIVTREGKSVSFIVNDNLAHLRQIETGLIDRNWIEVKSGLNTGEKVVIFGHEELEDGTSVKIVETDMMDATADVSADPSDSSMASR
jgi:multidrug efflux pump subunit AcrA (membrane-fusion protein)